MFSYMQPKDGPVIDGLESQEVVYAKDQPEYIPLRTLKHDNVMGCVVSRWSLTEEQRKAVAEGADIILEQSTIHRPLNPIRMGVGDGKSECPMDSVFGIQIPIDTPTDTPLAKMDEAEFTKVAGVDTEGQ